MILIHLDWEFNRIYGLKSRIESNWVKLFFKRFPTHEIENFFGLALIDCIGLNTEFEIIRNSLDLFGMIS